LFWKRVGFVLLVGLGWFSGWVGLLLSWVGVMVLAVFLEGLDGGKWVEKWVKKGRVGGLYSRR